MILGLVLVSIGMIQMIEERDSETITVWRLLEDIGTSARRKNRFLENARRFQV
jgi:hypothetical protein